MSENEQISAPAVFGAMTFASAPGVEHLAVAGELCAATVAQFELALAGVSPDSLVVVLDLSAVTFLDDDARRTIHAAVLRLRADRRRMVLIASDSVRRALDGTAEARERIIDRRGTSMPSPWLRPRTRDQHVLACARARLPRRAPCQ